MKIVRIVLTVVFGWSLFKSIELLSRTESVDFMLFRHTGLLWLFYFLLMGVVVCQAVSLVWFWKPFPQGFLFALGAVLIKLTEASIALMIAMGNTDLAKQAIIRSRESRGLAVRPEAVEMMSSPHAQWGLFAVSVVLAIIWCVLILMLMKAAPTNSVLDP